MKGFDITKYLGKWYTIEKDSTGNIFTLGADCTTREFKLFEDGTVEFYFRSKYNLMRGYTGNDGTLYDCLTDTCMASMSRWSDRRIPFRSLSTDYENYNI